MADKYTHTKTKRGISCVKMVDTTGKDRDVQDSDVDMLLTKGWKIHDDAKPKKEPK